MSFDNLSSVRLVASGVIRGGETVRVCAIYSPGPAGTIALYNGADNTGPLLLHLDVPATGLEFEPGGAHRFPQLPGPSEGLNRPTLAGEKTGVEHGGCYVELTTVTSATIVFA